MQQGTRILSDDWLKRYAPYLLAAIALLILLPANHLIPLIDRDEPRFAQATREMIQRGEWIVPYFNNQYRFDKPILIYWIMRAAYAVFGVNEFAARLPSVLSTILFVLIVFHMGSRWFSVRAGFFAAFGLLTCAQVLMHGRSAVADMPMVAMVALAQYALFELLHDESPKYPWKWFWLFYGALGLGFLAKGPVTFAVPILTLLFMRLFLWRKPIPWRRLRILPGLIIVLVLMGSWGIPALIRTGGLFWSQGMETHVWERGFETFQGHGSFFFYYFVTALISLFPWSAFFGDGIAAVKRNWSEKNAFLLAWFLGTYILFSVYKTKLPHYVMPAFPALFLMLGQAADTSFRASRAGRIFFRVLTGLVIAVGLVAIVLAFVLPFAAPFVALRKALLGGAGVLLSLAALGILWRRNAVRLLVLPLLGIAVFITFLGAGLRSVSPAVQLMPLFREMPEDTRFGFHGFREPSMVFYAGRRWEGLETDDLQASLDQPGPCMVGFQENEVRAEDFIRPLFGKPPKSRDFTGELAGIRVEGFEERTVEGLNIARTATARLKVYYRR
jgi:4-amino-4-deoxy-L-arabinose transferase-like glycosyltransferase